LCLTLVGLLMIEFLRSAKQPGHTTRDSSLGIDQETALAAAQVKSINDRCGSVPESVRMTGNSSLMR
jgi:hypothetical protein